MSSSGPLRPGVILVGGGKMGGALLAGWLRGALKPNQAYVVEPDSGAGARAKALGVTVVTEASAIPADFRPGVLVLAVKPQIMESVLPAYRGLAGDGALVLSIAAGRTIGSFAKTLGPVSIVRAMPNTPAAIGRGITVACPGAGVSPAMRERATTLLAAVGEVAWVEDEALMDAVTAVSGSGPSYVFLMIETLAAAGVEAGLPAPLAARLALVTVAGAGALAQDSGTDPAELRRNVTSPGGTTQAALEVLMAGDGLGALMSRAVAAATRRSRELAR
ncbi:MAG: pyrroline-5-carboxylate reductase [Alphaproteobacteria bacterium]|nr:pyrroline-5-carboxylate reductase [Alphaproteobacteria bacterium]